MTAAIDFDYQCGAFSSRSHAAQQKHRLVTDYCLPERGVLIEGRPGEYRLYFPLIKRYFWPTAPANWTREEQDIAKQFR